jgi:hypothetical protein
MHVNNAGYRIPNIRWPVNIKNYYMQFSIKDLTTLIMFVIKDDGLVKSRKSSFFVIPAKAGIQSFRRVIDSGFRRSDGF